MSSFCLWFALSWLLLWTLIVSIKGMVDDESLFAGIVIVFIPAIIALVICICLK